MNAKMSVFVICVEAYKYKNTRNSNRRNFFYKA